MTLQVRVYSPGNNATILNNLNSISYFKSVNSSDEGISFDIPKNSPNASILDPYSQASFTNIWEVWDTVTNKRLNYGPISSIEDSIDTYKVVGAGRSAFLQDHYKTLKTFYASIDRVIEEVRYENLASAPSTKVLLTDMDESNADVAIVFPVSPDETYYGLSKRTREFVIDDNEAYIPVGKIEPSRAFSTTSEYWTGMSTEDTMWLDFGEAHDIHRIKLMFPWWGGPQRSNDRTYDFKLNYANDGTSRFNVIQRDWTSSIPIYNSLTAFGPSRVVTTPGRPLDFYIGSAQSGLGTGINVINALQGVTGPINARYIGIDITDVHAWYGSSFDAEASHDGYLYQCSPDYLAGDDSYFGSKDGLMTYRTKAGVLKSKAISDTKVTPANDCHASIVEFGVYKEIIEKKTVKPLALQRIDNNNVAITYYRVPDASEIKPATVNGISYKKWEPGTFFSKINMSYSGASSTYTTFYKKDCTNCYPDGYSFAIADDENNMVYMSDSSSGSGITMSSRQKMSYLMERGASSWTINWTDCWRGKTDPLSWGGSYSYTEKTGDYFSVHFRGESFKWYATIPSTKTGATVKIERRFKSNATRRLGAASLSNNYFSSWSTLEAALVLPNNITNQVVYEIPYGGSLSSDTIYEIRITLLDDNYCSIDSIEGYWSASFTEYNEDSTRVNVSNMSAVKQIYNKKFSAGSMYKWNKPGVGINFSFEGDRVILKSAKGRHHGNVRILMYYYDDGVVEYDPGVSNHVFIPGGDATDGSLFVSLDTGKKGQEITQYVIFDSDTYFKNNGGLPWGKYTISLSYNRTDAQKYTTDKYETGSDNFTQRCHSCSGKLGTQLSIYEYVYFDSIIVHEKLGLSVQFQDQTHLDIIKSVAEAIQVEWDATESGLRLEPRLGTDTQYAMREGENVLVNYSIVNDVTKVATRLLSQGSDIDGLPLSTIVEDKKTKRLFGRNITRQVDFRDIADYTQLIGLSRMELRKRNRPEKRITVSYIGNTLPLVQGDSFMLWTKKMGNIRVRISRKEQVQSAENGTVFNLECAEWPQII